MKPQHLTILLTLAQKGIDIPIKTSSIEFAKELQLSQQSTARLLAEMEQQGLLQRQVKPNGQLLSITRKGRKALLALYTQLGEIFAGRKKIIAGTFVEGLGEGKYYMSLSAYKKQFKKKLDFIPYAGTLNVEVKPEIGKMIYADPTFFQIAGFTTKKRTYGGLRCKRATLIAKGRKIQGAVIIPDRTSHEKNIIEFIASVHVKEKINIQSGEEVKIEL
ncbi:CTP-dependent riboflavin kinase [Candidatus Woesearchaeota archaeon]|nr:CTP-dependent riboflavin kinase [Candidatus Woesearchaeota archaeon]